MGCYNHNNGIDTSLLFFFLILVLVFCNPGILGLEGCLCGEREESCTPACGC